MSMFALSTVSGYIQDLYFEEATDDNYATASGWMRFDDEMPPCFFKAFGFRAEQLNKINQGESKLFTAHAKVKVLKTSERFKENADQFTYDGAYVSNFFEFEITQVFDQALNFFNEAGKVFYSRDVEFTGSIPKGQEVQYYNNEKSFATVNLSVVCSYDKNAEKGQKTEYTFFSLKAFDYNADKIKDCVERQKIFVRQGRMGYNRYEGQNGQVWVTEVIGNMIFRDFVAKKKVNSSSNGAAKMSLPSRL